MKRDKLLQNIRIHWERYKRKRHINRHYRDRLFCTLFGQDKEALLQLYNGLHDTQYTDASQLTVITLNNIIYMKMVNDLAFIVVGVLNLYEHQSTYNPNMPLRFLLYIAEEYDTLVMQQKANLYGSKLIELPTPQCVVFYNGNRDTADEEILHLSDAYQNKDIPADLELTVHLRNINLGHNEALMKQCHKLWEYASLIDRVNRNLAEDMSVEAAIEEAITYCIDHNILADFLTANRSGVIGMLRLLTEYDEKKTMKMIARDAREEGYNDGLEAGRSEGLSEGMRQDRVAVIFELLSVHGDVPETLQTKIREQTNLSVLRTWCHIAATCESVADFEKQCI